jgi:hypothetical protein
MPFNDRIPGCAALVAALCWAAPAGAGELAVVAVSPARHSLDAAPSTVIRVEFDQPLDVASVGPQSFGAFGRWSGPVEGTYAFSQNDTVVTLTPDARLFSGEQVMVVLSNQIKSAGGTFLRSAGYSWQFWTRARSAAMAFKEIDSMSTRTVPEINTRSYGGIATDLDNDGWADLTIVNEDTADLRVFLNRADGTGLYHDFLEPPSPVNDRASPSEPADFNGDGFADVCVANIDTASVSVLLGNGDGSYGPQQEITVGVAPRGIAVLDADGDGDVDIVNTNSSSSNMSLLVNDGNGVFGAPTFWEGGGVGEWALAAADMNDDGIMDLAVGARTSQLIVVNLGNGDGTFTVGDSASAGGAVWMLNCADLDGNGTEDVATANSTNNNGGIILGDGAGNVALSGTFGTDPFPLATDVGDVDGDGDLDWVTSSFSGDWWLFLNDGSAGFAFAAEFNAPSAASCALMVDIDNDCDLDLALIDELADVVVLQSNGGNDGPIPGDLDGNCSVGTADLLALLAAWGPCPEPCPPFCPADLDENCSVGTSDLLTLLANWG